MKKLLYFSLSMIVISAALLSMQRQGDEPSGPSVELVSNNGESFSLPRGAAELSPTLQTILSMETHEQAEQRIPFGHIDGETLLVIVNILTALHEKIAQQEAAATPPQRRSIKQTVGDGYVTQNLQMLVDPLMRGADSMQVMIAFAFLEMPALTNATCKLFVATYLDKNPIHALSEFMGKMRELLPETLLGYAQKHFLMRKASITTELTIADYITLEGMPKMNVESGVNEIDLREKSLTSLDGIEHLPRVSQLQVLDLSRNKLTILDAGAFQGCTSLWKLFLFHNELVIVAPLAFQGLVNLLELELADNKIAHWDDGTFQDLRKLRVLGLTGNKLTMLTPGMFHGLVSLQRLWFNVNELTTVPEGTFEELRRLRELHLDNNFLPGTVEEFRQQQGLANAVDIKWEPQKPSRKRPRDS